MTSPEDRKEQIDSFLKLSKHWHDQMARHHRTFAEDYCRGAVSLIYELNIAAPLTVEHERTTASNQPILNPKAHALVIFYPKVADPHGLKLWNQKPVFVVDVEVVKAVENVPIPSLVGLYDVQKQISEEDDGLLVFSLSKEIFKMLPCRINGETDLVGFRTVMGRKLIPNMIKSTSEVVESIPKDGSEIIWNGLSRDDLDKLLKSLGLRLGVIVQALS